MRVFFASIAVLVLLLPVCAQAEPVIGQPAPALTATTFAGQTFDLSGFKGKIVVINFWASWCPPCHDEMPVLEALYRQYHGKGVEFLGVSADGARTHTDAKEVMHYFTYPAAYLDKLGKNDFGTPNMIPVTYVVSKDGSIADILSPTAKPLTEAGLSGELKSLLDVKQAKPEEKKPDDKKTDDKKPEDSKQDDKKPDDSK